MKKVLYFVILTFTLVQGNQVVHKRGGMFSSEKKQVTESSTDKALSDLMTQRVPIRMYNKETKFPLISVACRNDMLPQCKPAFKMEKAFHCDFSGKETCYVIGTPSAFDAFVFSKTKTGAWPEIVDLPPGSEEFSNRAKYQAVFLPFGEKIDTYTILDPFNAPWFFTAELGGCDMFVATVENQGNKPLVVHSNRNEEKVVVKNLKLKEQVVDSLITSVNPAYNVIARVHLTSTNEEEKKEISQHLSQYALIPGHEGIRFLPYDDRIEKVNGGGFHFFGHYDCYDGEWTFVLKGISSGYVFFKFSVSTQGKVKNFQELEY